MNPIDRIRGEFVEFIPSAPQSGVLYISTKYKTATHLCCCGCGNKVVTPLKPGGWHLTAHRGVVSLYPSIGSWSLPCKSHYWIRSNSIVWAPQWSQEEIHAGRQRDQHDRELHFDAPKGLADRLMAWIKSLFT